MTISQVSSKMIKSLSELIPQKEYNAVYCLGGIKLGERADTFVSDQSVLSHYHGWLRLNGNA